MKRIGNNSEFNGDINKHMSFDRELMIPQEVRVALTPKSKYFWNFIFKKEKASFLGSARGKPKPKPSFTRKLNKYEIEALLHQCIKFDKDNNAEDKTTSEDFIEKDNYILVNYEIAKTINLADLHSRLSMNLDACR